MLSFEDETWWSRLAQPSLHTFSTADEPLRLQAQSVPKDEGDKEALACYGLLLRQLDRVPDQLWLRFVDGRPLSSITTQFLEWASAKVAALGKTALLLVWDNAPWHVSKEVRVWVRAHNCQVKAAQKAGVRIIVCYLPTKSPWLNPIEPKWVHGKRRVLSPARLLTADELEQRVCATFGCPKESHLTISAKVA